MKLELSSPSDRLDLAEIETDGVGFQALAGITGLGLPQLSVQWLEGAGDGAAYRGRRVLPRDIDIPLDIVGRNRGHLADLMTRLARVLADDCTLTYIDSDGVRWSTPVRWTGGGAIDPSSGERDVQTVVSLRAPSPYFLSESAQTVTVGGTAAGAFLSTLSAMPISSSQAIGSIQLTNEGDVPAYPVWEVTGPGDTFKAISPTGETIQWNGTLAVGEKLIVDMGAGTVKDGNGVNKYSLLATAPRFWSVPPGPSTATASLLNITSASKVVCSWRPRKWVVI
ncbi:phage distal tail protein [Actinacidiphila glaucinigra]|uniref:Phage-related protein n=1 Tax=Actinacidiphila glaucinigra TaxID=235986 RepID=A0A239F0T6_9ACTN|nr:phage tail domain-containing protein [Actinacidiphila glaucinigra]SNS50536.1 Phage-related protein [Actinacidiphila glaucinigra]